MSQPYINVAFPCPRCQQQLQIPNFTAVGPCPFCKTEIKMELKLSLVGEEDLAETDDSFSKKRYSERVLRANTAEEAQVVPKPYHPPQDWR